MNNTEVINQILNLVKNLSSEVKNLSSEVKILSSKSDKIENEVKNLSSEINIVSSDISIIKKDIISLKNHRIEVKSYQSINSKEYEKEITRWLYNYLINNDYSLHYYIPTYEEFPRNILNINNKNQKLKTITDLDGVIIGSNMKNLYKSNSNIKYKICIIEAKHTLTISKIKKKIRQVIKFYKIIKNPTSIINLQKYKDFTIYLYFSSPLIKKEIYNFIIDKKYLESISWNDNKNIINMSELNFINNIYLISNNNGEYKIMNNIS